ncbi:MAG: 4-(cytidine 5'-diphospho)-2-C-methyl-D-erythritol kinase [Rhodobacter sp.]|nr:4-(cytidine 5'-diphospho)-2-C-methyl-D-erythritol kinase [Rhodobacter sp.]
MATEPVAERAPAKINLCLHVCGRRADGYHLLDSLVVFAGAGDRVTAVSAAGLHLTVEGPESAGLSAGRDNLVLRAARAMEVKDAALGLWKALPVASGIGGGSADAAAALRALSRLTGRPLPNPEDVLALGADVPVCLAGLPARMRGVGEELSPLPPLPPVWLVLVNPRVAVSTPQVFAALERRENPPVPELPPSGWPTATALGAWLDQLTRNDLEAPARRIAPVLGDVDTALKATAGCLLARMSGSGATCFGLYADVAAASDAARDLRAAHPGWWVTDTTVLT